VGIVVRVVGMEAGSRDAVQHVHCSVQVTVPVYSAAFIQACSQWVGGIQEAGAGAGDRKDRTYRVASGAGETAPLVLVVERG